jgi:ribose transport system substrate-binding protein
MKRKITAVIASTIVLATAVGTWPALAADRVPRVVFVPGDLKDEFWITMSCGVKEAAKNLGAEISIQAPQDGTATTQKPLVDSIVASHPDVLVISPDDSVAMQIPIQAAAEAGIKVVLVNNTVTDPSFAVSSVLSNDKEGGTDAFKAIQALHPAGGKVLVVGTQPGFQNTDDRITGFQEAVKNDPKFSLLGVQYSHNSPQTAAQVVGAALQRDPDIVAVFAVNVNSAEGAATGLQQAGKAGSVSLIGYDAGPGQIEDLRAGVVQALIAQQPSAIGSKGVELGLAALNGKPVEKLIRTPLTIITRDNVDSLGKLAAYHSSCD